MSFFCYLLHSGNTKTYIGATVDPDRRLRQHNGELVGGARRTSGLQWKRALYVGGFPDWTAALQFEWAWKYHGRQGQDRRGLCGKIRALLALLNTPKSTRTAVPFALWTYPPWVHMEEGTERMLEKIEGSGRLLSSRGGVLSGSNLSSLLSNTLPSNSLPSNTMSSSSRSSSASSSSPSMETAFSSLEALVRQQSEQTKQLTHQLEELNKRLESAMAALPSEEGKATKTKAGKTKAGKAAKEPKEKKEKKPKKVCPEAAEGVVRFSSSVGKDPHRIFSPLYKQTFTVEDQEFGSVEHYAQWSKYKTTDPDYAALLLDKAPATLRMAGKTSAHTPDPDYDVEAAYKTGYQAQLAQNEDLKAVLLATAEAPLEAEYPADDVLGIGEDGTGQNLLGTILMALRTEMAAE